MSYAITAIRPIWSDDGTHQHVESVGYESAHMPGEPIMVPVSSIATKIAFGESYYVTVDGERAEVSVAKCDACGYEPELKTSKDTAERKALLELPVN